MTNKMLKVLIVLCLNSMMSCSQSKSPECSAPNDAHEKKEVVKSEPHQYGGWYCPDNLNGFPATDVKNWASVPVIHGRMATKEETQTSASLIYVDPEKHPNAKHLDIKLPRLASYYNEFSKREDLVIVIQAFNIGEDSIVGFRYLNGGNGSSWLNEVNFLSNDEIDRIPKSNFVTHSILIEKGQDKIWEVLTTQEYAETLRDIFDKKNKLDDDWWKTSKVNYKYTKTGIPVSSYASKLFGNFYIQNDHLFLRYTEKFLLLEDRETGKTELKIVCGPYGDDFDEQKSILVHWSEKVKELSEAMK